jgi:hypothetical protein
MAVVVASCWRQSGACNFRHSERKMIREDGAWDGGIAVDRDTCVGHNSVTRSREWVP